MTSFLKGMEIKALFLERQKEEEIAKESRKTAQLEDLLRRVEIEKQTYQRTAIEKEAMAMALNKTLERIRGEMVCSSSAEDGESCCDLPDKFNEGIGKMTCKACNSGESRFIILPCKHLCLCEMCDALLHSCPVCRSVKQESMEVYMV